MARAAWLADVARVAGLRVIEVDGWQTRGADTLNPRGVVCHHTGTATAGDMPTLRLLVVGRSDLTGPLCNYALSRSGVVYVVASGKANHAGAGGWRGVTGNSSMIGIEAENNGRGEPWSAAQMDAYVRLCRAIIDHLGRGAEWVCGHKEWAPHRKDDPAPFNMDEFRAQVANVGAQPTPAPAPAPAPVPAPIPPQPAPAAPPFPLPSGYYFGPKSGPTESVSGYYSHGDDLKRWQQQMISRGWRRVPGTGRDFVADGRYGNDTAAVTTAFQTEKHMRAADGKIGPLTWAAAWTAPVT